MATASKKSDSDRELPLVSLNPVFGTDLLVAVDATNLSLLATLSANTAGVFSISDITRRAPAIAGTSVHVQVYETSPAIRASRGISFTAIP